MTLAEVRAARERLRGVARVTPVVAGYDLPSGAAVHLKAECLQRTGSFKIRGAWTKVSALPRETRGVACMSAGNHARGVALAARLARFPALVVMPEDAPLAKVERTRAEGAEVVLHGRSLEEAEEHARALAAARGLALVHPFDDDAILAGQATLGLELLEQLPDLEQVVIPVGGGGLAGAAAFALKESRPRVRVVGVQAEGSAAAALSWREGKPVAVALPQTIADGIRVGRVCERTLDLLRRHVDDVVSLPDEAIAAAMVRLLDGAKLVVEPAGAAAVAALETGAVEPRPGTCAVLSGGNVDLNVMARAVERGLTRAGRYLAARVRIPDRPGGLFRLLGPLARLRVNVLDLVHRRAGYEIPLGSVEVLVLAETRDAAHGDEALAALRAEGFEAEREPAGG